MSSVYLFCCFCNWKSTVIRKLLFANLCSSKNSFYVKRKFQKWFNEVSKICWHLKIQYLARTPIGVLFWSSNACWWVHIRVSSDTKIKYVQFDKIESIFLHDLTLFFECNSIAKAAASAEDLKWMKIMGDHGEYKLNVNDPAVERVRR